jgi:glyoxylase-like metal-dependent hydrolase (beta-lactamase superfamily II)
VTETAPALPVRDTWFEAEVVGGGITRYVEPSVHPFLRANCWHIRGRDRDLLIDAGLGVADLAGTVRERHGREPDLFVTHDHLDHQGGAYGFARRIAHRATAVGLASPEQDPLVTADLPSDFREALKADDPGGDLPAYLVDAVPRAGYRPESYRVVPAPATELVEDGDVIDLGDRALEVLHLAGHTPGSAALFDRSRGLLFSGDVVYDGTLLDELPESDIADYVDSMRRLLTLPVRLVHAGHDASFDGDRLAELCQAYLDRRA